MARLRRVGTIAVAVAASFALERAAQAQCPGRPTDPGGVVGFDYGAATVAAYDTPAGNFRVHYTEDGPDAPDLTTTPPNTAPDFVVTVGDVAEASLEGYADLGFRPPKSDVAASCDSDGGDDRVDIYLVDFGAGDGQVVAGPCASEDGGRTCAAFALVDHHLSAYPDDLTGARTVVAHELFHIVQNAYVADLEPWLSEGTAQWAADHLHPELEDLEAFLPAYFDEADRSIDNPPGGAAGAFLYGAAIWPVFLEQRFDVDAVRSILEAMSTGLEVWPAHDAALAARQSSMASAFPEFATWNAATGARSGSFGYVDAADYPEVAVEELTGALPLSHEGITSGFSSRFLHVDVGETRALATLDSDPSRNAGVVVPLVDGVVTEAGFLPMPATFQGEAILVVAGVSPAKPDGPFTVDVVVAPEEGSGGGAATSPTTGTSGDASVTSGAATGGGADDGATSSGGDEDAGDTADDDGCSCGARGAPTRDLGAAWLVAMSAGLVLGTRRTKREASRR